MRKIAVLLFLTLAMCACQAKPPALAQVTPEDVGLTWRECAASALESAQVEACLGSRPVRSAADAARQASRTGSGLRLDLGATAYETRHLGLGIIPGWRWDPYVLLGNGRPLAILFGKFETYDPDVSLQVIGGQAAWEFASARTATIIYGGRDLRRVYELLAAYRPYELGGKLAFIGKKDGRYFLVYDGRQVGPSFERMPIAYCCEAMIYAPTGAEGRYRFWGYREGQLYAVEITANGSAPAEAAYRDNQLCFAVEVAAPDWTIDGTNGAAWFTHNAGQARYNISVGHDPNPTLDLALDEVKRGALGHYMQGVEDITVSGQPARWVTFAEGTEIRYCVLVIAPECGEDTHTLFISARQAGREAFQAFLEQVRLGTSAILLRAFKGWELYSWPVGNNWRFTLIEGTNRLKTYEEITADGGAGAGGLPKFTVTGVEALEAALARLPRGERVFWANEAWWEQVQGARGGFAPPDPATVERIVRYCEQRGIVLQLP
jgi:hypothetical protein